MIGRHGLDAMHRPIRLLASGFAGVLNAAVANAAPLDEVAALVESNRAGEALARCASLDVGVEPKLDLWCGIAAVDAGRPGIGVLALERYSLRFPDDMRGRLELARAYFYANDDRRAREEFEAVLAANPPSAVQTGIRRYLDTLAAREAQYLRSVLAWIEVGGGWDSNLNVGVSQADLTLPVLGPVTVAEAAREKGGGLLWLAANVQVNQPVAPGVSVFAGVAGNGSFYPGNTEFDLGQFAVSAGGRYVAGANTLTANYAYGQIDVGGDRYRSTNGIGIEWQRLVSSLASASVAVQYAQIGYTGANEVRDADYWGIGVGYRRIWLVDWQPVLNLVANYGDEHNTQDAGYWSRKLYGIAADVTVSPSTYWALNAGVGYLRSNYGAPLPILGVTRHDANWTASLSAIWFFARNLSARAEYQYARNDSNVELYEYARNLVALKLRYDFR